MGAKSQIIKVLVSVALVLSVLLTSLACFIEPKKAVWLEPVVEGETLAFEDLVDSAKYVPKFRKDKYYVYSVRVKEVQSRRLLWDCYLLPYSLTSPNNFEWDLAKMSELPVRLEYGKPVKWLKEVVPPETLKPGVEYEFEITVLGLNEDGKNNLHFWIKSYFEVPHDVRPWQEGP